MRCLKMNDQWDNANANLLEILSKKVVVLCIRYKSLARGLIDRDALPAASVGRGLSRMCAMLMATHYGLPFFFVTKNA